MRHVKILSMELNHETVSSAPKDASSLLLLRPHEPHEPQEHKVGVETHTSKFEVLLLKRHSQSNVLGGAHVFPGGKCDDADGSWAQAHLPAGVLQDMHQSLAEPKLTEIEAAALFVAALREAHEECGVLLAHERNAMALEKTSTELDLPALQTRVNAQLQGEPLLSASLATLGIELCWHWIRPWSRWITPQTPTVMNKRFDARFFVALMPPKQTATHDEHEITQSDWFTPQDALRAYANRRIDLAAPQIMTLLELSKFATVQCVLAQAQARTPPLIEPCSVRDDDSRMVCFPGDPLHPVSEHILPGPTRLYFKQGCFQPEEGLDFFLSPI